MTKQKATIVNFKSDYVPESWFRVDKGFIMGENMIPYNVVLNSNELGKLGKDIVIFLFDNKFVVPFEPPDDFFDSVDSSKCKIIELNIKKKK